jgi:flagellar basal body rod protein FlgG
MDKARSRAPRERETRKLYNGYFSTSNVDVKRKVISLL